MKLYIYFVLYIILLGCSKRERISPKVASITESVYASGIVKAESQYKVYPDISGILRKKHVSIGDTVKEGDVIFTIDNTSAVLASENAELILKRSRENLSMRKEFQRQAELAKTQYQQDSLMYMRQKNLWKQHIGSKVELEQRRLAAKASKTNYLNSLNQLSQAKTDLNVDYQTARNNLEISQEEVGNYLVRSGMDGKVFTIYLEEGEFVSPQTTLAVVGKPESFLIEIEVDENDIGKVKIGQEIFVTMDSYGDSVYKAHVTKIHPIMNEGTGTFTVEGLFTDAPFRLYPNLTLESNILVNYKKDALIIPREYLIEDKYVLIDGDKQLEVVVGLKNFEYAEITKGLTRDQLIYKP